MTRSIWRWLCFGLLIRLLMMPFSFHGHDLFFIYYYPFKFISSGAWDPYGWIQQAHPGYNNPYYPPVLFILISGYLALIKPLLPHLGELFATFEAWNFTWEGNTIHYASLFLDHQLFRTLFIFKLPILIFDIATGWLLLKHIFSDQKQAETAFKIWMLNPFVLHSGFALGQIDIFYTFLFVLCITLIQNHRYFLTLFMLTLATLMKIFPLIVLPFVSLLMARKCTDNVKFAGFVILIFGGFIAPFYFSSGPAVLEALFFGSSGDVSLRSLLFFGVYGGALLFFFLMRRGGIPRFARDDRNEARDDKNEDRDDQTDLIVLTLTLPLIIFLGLHTVTLRYFICLTPFLIYLSIRFKYFWIYALIFCVTLFELRAAGNSQQWGLFAALHPTFFSALPIQDSYLNQWFDVTRLHQWSYRIFVLSSLVMTGHILWLLRGKRST